MKNLNYSVIMMFFLCLGLIYYVWKSHKENQDLKETLFLYEQGYRELNNSK